MSPLKLKLFVALHVLVALAFFGATLWIASSARQPGRADGAAMPAPVGQLAPLHLPAGRQALQPRQAVADAPEWLRQSQARDLERPLWTH